MSKELKIRITGDASGLRQATDEGAGILASFSNKVGAFGVAAGNLLADGIKSGFGIAKGFLRDSIGGASDMAETVSKVGVLFGDAAGEVEKFAAGAATSLGQSKQQAMDAAATFATFGQGAGLTGKDLAKFSTDLTGLASDMASFSNTTPEDAIQAIGSALRGEAEPIRRYGVLLDDASLRQKALELGITRTTKDALTPQQKVLAAQALIFAQTSKAQGDFGRTSSGLANQQRILAAQLDNTKAAIGVAFLPAVLSVTTALTTKLLPVLEKVGPLVATELVGGFRAFADAFKAADGDVTSAGFPGVMERIGYFARIAWDQVSQVAGTMADVATAVWNHAQPALSWLVDNFAEIKRLGEIVIPIIAGAAAAFKLFTTAQTAVVALGAFASTLKTVIPLLFANPWALVAAGIGAVIAGLVVAYKHSERFRNAVDTLWVKLRAFYDEVVARFRSGGIGEAARYAWDQISSTAVKAFSALGSWLQSTALPWLGEMAGRLISFLGEWITGTALPWLGEQTIALAEKLGGWITDAAVYLRDNLPGWLGALTEWLVGTALPAIIIEGNKLAFHLAAWIGESAVELLKNLPGWLWKLQSWLATEALPKIAEWGFTAAKELGRAFFDASDWMGDVAVEIVEGLIRGLWQMAGKLASAVRDFVVQTIPGPIRAVLDMNSPSRVMMAVGHGVAEGLAVGIDGGARMVSSAALGLADAALFGAVSGGSFTASSSAFQPMGATAAASVGGPMTINIQTGADPNAVVTAIQTYRRKNGGLPW